MQARLFDLTKPIPFMQGMALKEIMYHLGGKVLQFGEIDEVPEQLSGHGVLYLKCERGGSIAESIWIDDGVSVSCHSYYIPSKMLEWKTVGAPIVGGPTIGRS
jgi:hypothetical protein